MAQPSNVDRAALAARIQGFGNVNPPPLEEETGSVLAKRAVGRIGDMIGEEVMLTVEDFKEKGAVGAVKDAVADAGDILIDGVTGLVGWIRGDAPPEEDSAATEDATKALSNGPSGAAYGISQASPTGGINAVWVMPEDADPATIAQLAQQSGGLGNQANDPRVPKNIQPYQPPPKPGMPMAPVHAGAPLQIPGGPTIAPYQPAPSGPGGRPPMVPPYLPGAGGYQQSFPGAGGAPPRWGPTGYQGSPGASSGGSAVSGAKALVERIGKGEVLVGPDVAKRLVSQCTASKTSAKQLGEIICERCRRLYLGLDGGDPSEADAALARLLGLTNALSQQGTDFTRSVVKEIKEGVSEELMSLRSSAKHKDEAEPLLRSLGFLGSGGSADRDSADLLGGGGGASSSSSVPAKEADLLGGASAPTAAAKPASAKEADLLGGAGDSDLLGGALASAPAAGAAPAGVASLDPLFASSSGGDLGLAGLSLDAPISAAPAAAGTSAPMAMGGGVPIMGGGTTMGAMAASGQGSAALAAVAKGEKKDQDAFGFVGAEIAKASGTS